MISVDATFGTRDGLIGCKPSSYMHARWCETEGMRASIDVAESISFAVSLPHGSFLVRLMIVGLLSGLPLI